MKQVRLILVVALVFLLAAPLADAQSRVPNADETRNRLSQQVIGNKADGAATVAADTNSMVAYLKGLTLAEVAGTADIDVSEATYNTGYVTLLTITPASGQLLSDVVIDLDYNLETTGWDTIATAADTLDVAVVTKVDGTHWRGLMNGTQIEANGDGTLANNEDGARFAVGLVGRDGLVAVRVHLSAERDDCEIPYRVIYRGAAPTITAVAAG